MTTLILVALGLTTAGAAPIDPLPAVSVDTGGGETSGAILDKLDQLTLATLRQLEVRVGAATLDDPAASWVESAKGLYYELDFNASAREAERAIEYYGSHPEHLASIDSVVDAHLFAALSHMERNKRKKASAHFRSILQLRPSQELSSAQFSPAIIRAFETAKGAVRKASRGRLTVASKPALATVSIDGKVVGQSPVSRTGVPLGRHVVQVELDGHLSAFQWVAVNAADQSVTLSLDASPLNSQRESLRDALAAGGADEAVAAAKKLAGEAGAHLLVLAVSTAGDELILSGARVTDARAATAWTTLSGDLSDAAPRVEALVKALVRSNPAGMALRPSNPPRVDYDGAFLGLAPAPAVVALATPVNVVRPVKPPTKKVLDEPAPPDDGSVFSSPWLWIAVGVVALAGAGAGVGVWYGTQPPAATGTGLRLELP